MRVLMGHEGFQGLGFKSLEQVIRNLKVSYRGRD
jgi:hypothetical protein